MILDLFGFFSPKKFKIKKYRRQYNLFLVQINFTNTYWMSTHYDEWIIPLNVMRLLMPLSVKFWYKELYEKKEIIETLKSLKIVVKNHMLYYWIAFQTITPKFSYGRYDVTLVIFLSVWKSWKQSNIFILFSFFLKERARDMQFSLYFCDIKNIEISDIYNFHTIIILKKKNWE